MQATPTASIAPSNWHAEPRPTSDIIGSAVCVMSRSAAGAGGWIRFEDLSLSPVQSATRGQGREWHSLF